MIQRELDFKYNNPKWLDPFEQEEDASLRKVKTGLLTCRTAMSNSKNRQIKPLQKVQIPRSIVRRAQNFFIVNGGKLDEKGAKWYHKREISTNKIHMTPNEFRDAEISRNTNSRSQVRTNGTYSESRIGLK